MVVGGQRPAQAAGAGQAAAAQMPARYTPAPAQRPRPDPNVSSMEDLVEYELELLAGSSSGAAMSRLNRLDKVGRLGVAKVATS